MKVKTYFSSIAFYFSPPTEFKKKMVYICILLNFEKNHRPEAEILAYKVGKYEKVTVS